MGKKRKHSRGRFVISSILSFLLAILLTVATVALAVKVGFVNKNQILDGLNYKDYYSGVEEQFYQDVKDLATPMGLPENVLEGIVESDIIHEDVRGYVDASCDGREYTFHTEELKQNLTDHIYRYFQEQGWQLTEEQLTTIPEFTGMIADKYVEDMKVPLVNYFNKLDSVYTKMTVFVVGGCLAVSVVIIIVLLRMQHWKHRAVRFVTYSTIAAAIMTAVPAVVVLVSGFYKRISIEMEYLYHAIVEYVFNGCMVFLYMSFAWVAVSAGLLLCIRYLKKNS